MSAPSTLLPPGVARAKQKASDRALLPESVGVEGGGGAAGSRPVDAALVPGHPMRGADPRNSCLTQPALVAEPVIDHRISLAPTAPHITDAERTEQRRRLTLVERYHSLAQAHSKNTAAKLMRECGYTESAATLARYRDAWLAKGEAGLLPAWRERGRVAQCALTDHEALLLRGLILARSTSRAIHFSYAVEEFRHHPGCTVATRVYIENTLDDAAQRRRAPSWPKGWRKAAMPTAQEVAKFHGPKHYQSVECVDHRGMFITDESGARIDLRPHSIWEMDDASDNAPRASVDPETGEEILSRQALWTQDLYSAAILSLCQVARSRDAYRIEDVADHVAACIRAHGLPERMRLEMGAIWAGAFFHGIEPELPGWPKDEKWGGLGPICTIHNTHKSKGKGGMENAFNVIQMMAAHAALDIGRERGDYEKATKQLVAAHRTGRPDERFWSMARSTSYMAQIAEVFNSRPKQRIAFGRDLVTPNDLLRGAKGREMPVDQWWRLCPVKKQATVRNDHVEISVDHYRFPFRFRVNGVTPGVHLDHGYRVLIAFHPGKPELGCHIFNGEIGSRNREHYARAQQICHAPVSELKPQIDLSGRADFSARKNSNAAVARSLRAVGAAHREHHRQGVDGQLPRVGGRDEINVTPSPAPTPSLRLAPREPISPANPFSRPALPVHDPRLDVLE
jgi:hypothetical protein